MPTKNELAAFLREPLMSGYKPSVVGSHGLTMGDRPWFSYWDVEKMRRDPQIRFGLGILMAPLPTVTWEVITDDQEVGQWVDRNFRRFWTRDLPKTKPLIEYGSVGGETVWEQDAETGMIEYQSFTASCFWDATPLEARGKLAGLRVKGVRGGAGKTGDWILPPLSLWITLDPEPGQLYGRGRLAGAWSPWAEKTGRHGALDGRRLYFSKYAYRGGVMYHPPGQIEVSDGVFMQNQDYAREVLERGETGGTYVFPNVTDEEGSRQWEMIDAAPGPPVPDLREYPKDLDDEMLRGMEIPPEVVKAAETGLGWAGRTVPFLVYLVGEDQIAGCTAHAFVEQSLRPAAKANFGEARAKFELRLKSLVPKDEGQDKGEKPSGPRSGPKKQGDLGSDRAPEGSLPVPGPGRMSHGDFREADHPRDGGKFATKPGSSVARQPQSRATVEVSDFDPGVKDRLPQVLPALLGEGATPQHVADAVGAPADARVKISQARTLSDGTIYLGADVTGPGYSFNRGLERNPATGKKWVTNDTIKIREGGQGLGTKIFADQVTNLAAMGFDHIDASGDRGASKNGYYTLARWGYDAPIPDHAPPRPKDFAAARTVQDLMATPAGRDWWKTHGVATDYRFDLAEGSRSRQVLAAYLDERKKREK